MTTPVRVACIGDSIVYGAFLENREKNNWPAVLGHWLGSGYEVRNFGISGTTMLKKGNSPYWNQKAYRKALAYKPNIVIISLGANDSKHPDDRIKDAVNNWQYKADFASDHKEMIASFKTANPSVKVYACVPAPAFPGNWGINDTTIREEIAPFTGENGVGHIGQTVPEEDPHEDEVEGHPFGEPPGEVEAFVEGVGKKAEQDGIAEVDLEDVVGPIDEHPAPDHDEEYREVDPMHPADGQGVLGD